MCVCAMHLIGSSFMLGRTPNHRIRSRSSQIGLSPLSASLSSLVCHCRGGLLTLTGARPAREGTAGEWVLVTMQCNAMLVYRGVSGLPDRLCSIAHMPPHGKSHNNNGISNLSIVIVCLLKARSSLLR